VSNATITDCLLAHIMVELRYRYAKLNRHYEAAFTDSFCTRRCCHAHETLIDAAKCAMPNGAGCDVIAVEYDTPLELTQAEDVLVNEFKECGRCSGAQQDSASQR
jgi:hypothetical protein